MELKGIKIVYFMLKVKKILYEIFDKFMKKIFKLVG